LLSSGTINRNLNMVSRVKIGTGSIPKNILIRRLRMLYCVMNFSDKPYAQKIASDIDKAIIELEGDCTTGKLRRQPFLVVLYGEPGVGKSSTAVRIAQACMRAKYGVFNDFDMVALNETDKFQSEYRTSHKVVLFDDIDASQPSCADTVNPWHKVIDFVNNIEKTALNPNVDMKGKVYIRPDLVIITTNRNLKTNSGIGADFIRSQGALARRINFAVHLHTGYERCSIKTAHSIVSSDEQSTFGRSAEFREVEGYQNIDREILYEFLTKQFLDHYQTQDNFVRYMNTFFDNTPIEDIDSVVYTPQIGHRCLESSYEVLESQAGFEDMITDIKVQENLLHARRMYLAQNVDWAFFVANVSELSYHDRTTWSLQPNGRLFHDKDPCAIGFCFNIYLDAFNEAVLPKYNLKLEKFTPDENEQSQHIYPYWRFAKLECDDLSDKHISIPRIEKASSIDEETSINYSLDSTEELQIDTALNCFSKVNQHPVRILRHAVHGAFEIDLIVEFEEVIFAVECKRSYLGAHYSKGGNKKQTKRSAALVHCYSKKRTFGLLYDYFGFRLVCDFGVTGQDMNPFLGFFQRVKWAQHICDVPYKTECIDNLLVIIHNEPSVSEFKTEEDEILSDLVIHYGNA